MVSGGVPACLQALLLGSAICPVSQQCASVFCSSGTAAALVTLGSGLLGQGSSMLLASYRRL